MRTRDRAAITLLLLLLLSAVNCGKPIEIFVPNGINAWEYVQVAVVRPDSVTIAWGSTRESNGIGQSASGMAAAEVLLDGRTHAAAPGKNFSEISGLQPDTAYPYTVRMGGRQVGQGEVRTWPRQADKLTFFVIGDFGSGDRAAQYGVAEAMRLELERSPTPVRFVVTTGDNIYDDITTDAQWDTRFYHPYRAVLARVPFHAAPGNHDGQENQLTSNLTHYLDNFFFPAKPVPGTHAVYSFTFGGGLAEFFALDSTNNTPGGLAPNYLPTGAQSAWLTQALQNSTARWKIPYFHHPIYSAGPQHTATRGKGSSRDLSHWVNGFEQNKVRVVFNGHEHNLQYTPALNGVRYVVTGAGGKLRSTSLSVSALAEHKIEAWAPKLHFLRVDIDGGTMRIQPLTFARGEGQTIKVEPVLASPLVVQSP